MQENISKSFIKFDNSLSKYKKYYNDDIKLSLNFINDIPTFELKNDNKILMKGDYNLIGVYGQDNNNKYFRWGWDYIYGTNKLENVEGNNTYYILDDIFKNKNENKDIIISKNENIINNTFYIKKIINYIFDLKINLNNYKELFFYEDMKNLFLHHIIKIENPLKLDLLLAMTLYITKSDLIWKVNDNVNNVKRYYLLRNVQEL
jgi:hypothetical protein